MQLKAKFDSAIRTVLYLVRNQPGYVISFVELLSLLLAQIGHLLEGTNTMFPQPGDELVAAKSLPSKLLHFLLQRSITEGKDIGTHMNF